MKKPQNTTTNQIVSPILFQTSFAYDSSKFKQYSPWPNPVPWSKLCWIR